MYGWIQQAIERLVLEKFGAETWAKIKAEAGCGEIPNDGWVRFESYDDELTLLLVGAASKVLGIPPETVLTVFGEYFIVWLVQQGYKGYLKSFGADMLTFLQNMNRMHANLKISMPEFIAPIIQCSAEPTPETCEYLKLEYKSHREGLAPMMIGIIKGCAEQLFDSSYDCTIEEEYKEELLTIESKYLLQVTIYRITHVSGKALHGDAIKSASSSISTRAIHTKSNYSFFQHNPNMAQGWVESVIQDVQNLNEEMFDDFSLSFDINMLVSLIKSFNPFALKAMTGLFRKPLCNKSVSMPVPTLGYVPETRGRQYLKCKSYPTPAMRAGVTFGSDCLVEVKGGRGQHQEPVTVLACAVPNLHTSVSVLKALAETPNDPILCCPPVTAILMSAWRQVLPRFLIDILIDVLLLALVTIWVVIPKVDYIAWPYVLAVALKEIIEEMVQLRAYYQRGWFAEYFNFFSSLNWIRLLLSTALIISILVEPTSLQSGNHEARYPLGLYACHRWWRLLFHLRAFESMGPKILPIMYAVMSLGPFTVVLIVVMLGFVYLLAALETFESPTWEIYSGLFQAGFLPEILPLRDSDWAVGWLYVVVVVIGVILVNILIGVLSESYDLHQDNHLVLFNRERANLIMKLSMCLFPRKVSWQRRSCCLGILMDLVSIESPERAGGDENSFLWFCMTKIALSQGSRLRNMKDHISLEADKLFEKLDENSAKVDRINKRISSLETQFQGLKCPVFSEKEPKHKFLDFQFAMHDDMPEAPLPSSYHSVSYARSTEVADKPFSSSNGDGFHVYADGTRKLPHPVKHF